MIIINTSPDAAGAGNGNLKFLVHCRTSQSCLSPFRRRSCTAAQAARPMASPASLSRVWKPAPAASCLHETLDFGSTNVQMLQGKAEYGSPQPFSTQYIQSIATNDVCVFSATRIHKWCRPCSNMLSTRFVPRSLHTVNEAAPGYVLADPSNPNHAVSHT